MVGVIVDIQGIIRLCPGHPAAAGRLFVNDHVFVKGRVIAFGLQVIGNVTDIVLRRSERERDIQHGHLAICIASHSIRR